MIKTALLVRLEAKPGKERAVENFLQSGLSIVQEEPATITWYAHSQLTTHYSHYCLLPIASCFT